MILQEDDLEFDFQDAVDAFKFDDDRHGLTHCMKAVDFVIELESAWLFVEVKDPSNPNARPANVELFRGQCRNGIMCDSIVGKFRDSFIYRWAEKALTKPIYYLNLMTLEEALLSNFQDAIRTRLPIAKPVVGWKQELVKACHVLNMDAWNRNFPKWPVRRISAQDEDEE